MKFKIISAVSVDGVIGIGDRIPWRIPEDFKHFRNTTMGNMLLIGYDTFLTLPPMALEGRNYIILNRDKPFTDIETNVHQFQFRSFDTVMGLLTNGRNKFDEVYVVGGASIYNLMIDYCDEAIITWVNKTYPDGDKKFPIDNLFANFVLDDWQSQSDWQTSSKGFLYKINHYKRIEQQWLTINES